MMLDAIIAEGRRAAEEDMRDLFTATEKTAAFAVEPSQASAARSPGFLRDGVSPHCPRRAFAGRGGRGRQSRRAPSARATGKRTVRAERTRRGPETERAPYNPRSGACAGTASPRGWRPR